MRISCVLPKGMSVGGVTTWSLQMANTLTARGYDVTLIDHVHEQPVYAESIRQSVQLLTPRGAMTDSLTSADIERFAECYQQALPGILIPNFKYGTFAVCARLSQTRAHEMRIIAFAHTDEDYYYQLLSYYEPIIHRYVAVSREVAQRLTRRLPQRAGDMVLRPYGIQTSPSLQRSWSSPHEPLKLMYAGRLVEQQKRVSDLARLATILTANGVDFQLDIVGEGADSQRLAASIDDSLSARVRLVGRLSHAQTIHRWLTADVCILVSEYEGTSVAMLEAMAAGCVPVVTAVSGAISTILPGVNGQLVQTGDMEGMAQIVQRLAADRKKVATLGQNAYETAKRDFSFDAYVDWFVSFSTGLLAEPPRRWPSARSILPRPSLRSRFRGIGSRGKQALQRLHAAITQR